MTASLTPVTRRYLRDFAFRLMVFLCIRALYLTAPSLLDFTRAGRPSLPLLLLWAVVLLSMVAQLSPKSGLTTGCLKQYPTRYDPAPSYSPQQLRQAVHQQNRGARRVAAVWLVINLCFGALYLFIHSYFRLYEE